MKTPAQINNWLASTMHTMDMPTQFLGDEPNTYRKPWAETELRMLAMACWGMEQAAGNQAIPLIYREVNEAAPEIMCDRWYFPATPRDVKAMERARMPVFGIESKHDARAFDVVGTSISYPVLTINLVKQLLMSGIPPTWEDRIVGKHEPQPPDRGWAENAAAELRDAPADSRGVEPADREGKEPTGANPSPPRVEGRYRHPERWPFLIAGGLAFGAPEVLANIVDCVFVGEAEDEPGQKGLRHVMRRILQMKRAGMWGSDRMECYRMLAREYDFLYFPAFVEVIYDYEDRPQVAEAVVWNGDEAAPSKQVVGFRSLLPGMRLPVRKRFVRNLDAVEPLVNPPLLYFDPGMGAADLQVQRGCPAWCIFCAATYREKPYRQRDVEDTVAYAKQLRDNTGSLHLAPYGLDFPMHTQKKRLLARVLEDVTDDVDASSMRVDDFIADGAYVLLQTYAGMDSVTLGVEGNSQRMRDFVGKGAADEDIRKAVSAGIRAGIKKFKLYMIASLPGEMPEDVHRILTLARDLNAIRASMGATCKIQFSWTPMLVEGNTPLQWFAPTSSIYALADMWEELRDLHIDFRFGAKAQRDKQVFFQLTQRASREIGMALVEAAANRNQGCWGGAPHGLYEDIEERLVAHGFLNGLSDAYDERDRTDMFGWEMIDQGVSTEMMWMAYRQAREFLKTTDAATYDEGLAEEYHGSEWIERCDKRCYGKACGVCAPADLTIRRDYIRAKDHELEVDLTKIKVIDQRSVAARIRLRVEKDDAHRLVMNDHWRYALRRAAYQAGVPIAKRTVRFVSDSIKFRDWTSGADYVEFGLTRRVGKDVCQTYVSDMNELLEGRMILTDWRLHPADAEPMRATVDVSMFDMEIDTSIEFAQQALEVWAVRRDIPVTVHDYSKGSGLVREKVNAKDYVEDMWLVRDAHRLRLRMLVRDRLNPYAVWAALFGKQHWLDAAHHPARRLEVFVDQEEEQFDFWHVQCVDCGEKVPVSLLDVPWDQERCPRCLDRHRGALAGAMEVV